MSKKILSALLILVSLNLYSASWVSKYTNNISRMYSYPYTVDDSTVIFGASREHVFEIFITKNSFETLEKVYSEWDRYKEEGIPPRPGMVRHFQYVGHGHIWVVMDNLLGGYHEIRRHRNFGYEVDQWDTMWIPNKELAQQYDYTPVNFVMYDTSIGVLDIQLNDTTTEYGITNVVLTTNDAWKTWRVRRIDTLLKKRMISRAFCFLDSNTICFINTHGLFPGDEQTPLEIYTLYGENGMRRYDVRKELFSNHDRYKRLHSSTMKWSSKNVGWCLGYYYAPIDHPQVGTAEAEWPFVIKTTNGGITWQMKWMSDSLTTVKYPNGANSITPHPNGKDVIITGNWGYILRTRDGGDTWRFEEAKENHENTLRKSMGLSAFWHIDKPYLIVNFGNERIWEEEPLSIPYSNSLTTENDIHIYPNPTTNGTTLSFTVLTSGDLNIKIVNVEGQELLELHNAHTDAGEFTKTFSMSKFPAGVYFIKINHNGNIKTEQIIRK